MAFARISFGRNCIIGVRDEGFLTHLTDYTAFCSLLLASL